MYSVTYIEVDVPTFSPSSPEETQTFRWCMPAHYLDRTIEAIDSITGISFTPARVSLGVDLGQRASLSVTFKDHKHIFAGEPYDQGTFFGKWRGRYGIKLRGRPLRLIRGYLGQAIADMDIRHYVIENTSGPTLDAVYTIEAKDVLKFADDDRAQAPLLSNGSLAGSINNSTTSATLSPAGIGDLEYPASGYVNIGGKEVCAFTRSGNALTITRGQFGSVAQEHSSGDRVQLVLRYDGDDVADIISDLLINYAGVPAEYITLADWTAETSAYLGVIYAATLTEPISVKTLISELIEQAALALYWDDRAQQIRLVVLREISTDAAVFNEENIIDGSLRVQEQPLKRISRIWTFYGQRDPTDTAANEDNYRRAQLDLDLAKEADYGSAEIRKIQARWIETETAASRLNTIQMGRFRDPPRVFSFDVHAGTVVTLAAGYTLEWWGNQDETGVEVPAQIQVTQVAIHADRVHIEAEEMLASGVVVLVNVVFLTTTGALLSYTVDASWNDADNAVETIGAGGGGGGFTGPGGGGGGGGAFSGIENLNLTPGGSVSYRVGSPGVGGSNGTAGGDTWFNGATLGASSVGAKGGGGGLDSGGVFGGGAGGTGGQASSGVGTTKYSGGDGGGGAPKGDVRAGGGGGGGAAGPNGDGADGASLTSTSQDAGGGGGGANGGSAGSVSSSSTGGHGGNNRFGFGGGDPSASGDEGGGGGGGNRDQAGGPGGTGEQIWTQTVSPITSAGPGGGGGGGGDNLNGGDGGDYGGGGGGGGGDNGGGDGAQGFIVLTWREA